MMKSRGGATLPNFLYNGKVYHNYRKSISELTDNDPKFAEWFV